MAARDAVLKARPFPARHFLVRALGLAVLGLLAWKAVRVVQLTRSLQSDLGTLEAMMHEPSLDSLRAAGPTLAQAHADLEAARREAAPALWLTPALGWAPRYGGDLAAAPALLDFATALLGAADEGYQGLSPLLAEAAAPDGARAVAALQAAAKHLQTARNDVEAALAARARFDSTRLSPRMRARVERLDPLLPLLAPGLDLALAAPGLLGADVPRTYLVLVQNEDELRATGGFISAAGTLTVKRGKVTALQLEDSYALDNFNAPYPTPPDPIRRYMLGELWLLRDSNWSMEFPAAAAQAEALYALARPGRVDGVIALDQAALRMALEATGPVRLPGTAELVTADNVTHFMRAAWSPEPGQAVDRAWWEHRKDFIPTLGSALLAQLPLATPTAFLTEARSALDGRHVLIWVKEPAAAHALAVFGWDGAVRAGDSDFLMVVDSNIGFNKVNAVARSALDYAVDLAGPSAQLTVTVTNPAPGQAACRHVADYGSGQYEDLIARCYWDLQRVLVPQGATLQDATPQSVSGEWLLSGEAVLGPPQVSVGEGSTTVFESLHVVAPGAQEVIAFRYALPVKVVQEAEGVRLYRLRVQKQAGTAPQEVRLQVTLPPGATFVDATPAGEFADGVWRLKTILTRDITVQLAFKVS